MRLYMRPAVNQPMDHANFIFTPRTPYSQLKTSLKETYNTLKQTLKLPL